MFDFTAENEWFGTFVIPLLIFVLRIGDVSLGTIRIIFVARGNKVIAPLLGFFEVFIRVMMEIFGMLAFPKSTPQSSLDSPDPPHQNSPIPYCPHPLPHKFLHFHP